MQETRLATGEIERPHAQHRRGLLVASVGGMLYTIDIPLLRLARSTGKNLVTSLAVGSLVSALFMSPWAEPATLSPGAWMWISLNGVIVVPLAGALIALGPRYLPAPEVAMFFLLDVVFTPVWMWLIFHELPTFRAFIGGLIVFFTLLIYN